MAHHQKPIKKKNYNFRSSSKYIFLWGDVKPSFWVKYIGEKVRTLGKSFEIKFRMVNMW
jgi:hypothetical protein